MTASRPPATAGGRIQDTWPTDIFTARPERIIGHVALASLVAGIPARIVPARTGMSATKKRAPRKARSWRSGDHGEL